MSWEVQGRQYHQWFGHGTGGEAAGAGGAGVADAVGNAAVEALGGAQGRALAAALRAGGAGWLGEALPVWVGASGGSAEAFRRVVGPLMAAGSAGFQAAGRALALGVDAGSVARAGAGVAAGLAGSGVGDLRFGLRAVRDGAVHAARGGLVVPVQLPVPWVLPPVIGMGSGAPGVGSDGYKLYRSPGGWSGGAADKPGGLDPALLVPARPFLERPREPVEPRLPMQAPGDAKGSDGAPGKPETEEGGDGEGEGIRTASSSPDPDDERESEKRKAFAEADQKLPKGMRRAEFGRLAGFKSGLLRSSEAPTEVSEEAVVELKRRGISREAIQAFRDAYSRELQRVGELGRSNASAVHREAILNSILRRY